MTFQARRGAGSTPLTATVSPAPAVDTGFPDLEGTPARDQSAFGTAADPGAPTDLDALVAAPQPNRPTTDWTAIQAFMAAVVPWPVSPEDAGYVNLHYSKVNRDPGQPDFKGMGWPFRSVDKFIQRAAWMNGQANFKEVWYCLSLQAKLKENPKNPDKPRAARHKADALSVKSLWIDTDVGPGKQYATVEDAAGALEVFRNARSLPPFSAMVASGGGLHAYWISDKVLTPEEWWPYANGLKALLVQDKVVDDPGLTTDVARILRVPGTFNYKYQPPRPVVLLTPQVKLYDFEVDFVALPDISPAPYQAAAAVDTTIYATLDDGRRPVFTKPAAAFADLDLTPLLNERLVPITPIFKQCSFYKGQLETGGACTSQPLWNLAVLGTTFMENGNKVAHAISRRHPGYTEDGTQALYDRKVSERSGGGLGPPTCSAIEGNGCAACATCPLRGEIKTPLSIRPEVTATENDTSSSSASTDQANWTGRPGISFSDIPHRPFLYGFDLVRGELTVIGSPGGAGKSSLAIGMAICAATNRELLGEKIRGGANLKALVINGEDSTDEIRRRVWAFSLAHGLTERDLGNLTIAGADDKWVQRISFLKTNEKGMSTVNQDGLDALQLALDALQPDIIVLDPLVSFCAGGNMNDNSGMSLVMRNLKGIAAKNRCAVIIVHHTRKGGDAGNVEAISGAAAITNLARRAIMPAPLTDADSRLGILPSERPQYFKLVDAKSNLVPRGLDVPLYRLVGVELPNPEPPLYPNGDNVQAITRVVLPTQSGANPDDLKIELAITEIVDRGKEIDGQAYPYSPSLAGANNERGLLPDAMDAVAKATEPRQWLPGDLKAVTDAAIKRMKADGRIVVGAMKDLMENPGRFRKAAGLKVVPI